MATDPETYLLRMYPSDLSNFGPSGLCGMTMYSFARDGRADIMQDWQAFALVQYEMNLLRQAFHAYGIAARLNDGAANWPSFCANSCSVHPGFMHPVEILAGFERLMAADAHPKAKAIEKADIVRYDAYFAELARLRLGGRKFEHLLSGLRHDPDCLRDPAVAYLKRRGLARIWQGY